MINNTLIKKIFEAAYIQRWNDHLRPSMGFTELDKQAHKVIIAYVIGKIEEALGNNFSWLKLIEGSVFETLQRIITTDIKPPIFYKLKSVHGEKFNRWIYSEIKEKSGIEDNLFFENLDKYLFDERYCFFEKKILKAAHYLATYWEFKIIYDMNKNLYGIEKTRENILSEIENHYDLVSVKEIMTIRENTRNFIDLVGQLRFQQRWAHTPRMPETSVLGHMYIVAALGYFDNFHLQICDRLKYNYFFGGIFHDLPEVMTRDIISPVKRGVEGLDELLKEIEIQQIKENVLPLLPKTLHLEIEYFVKDEFECKFQEGGKTKFVSKDELFEKYNDDNFNPVDGKKIKEYDIIAAYFEALISIENGIKPITLLQAKENMEKKYKFLNIFINE
ncbi:HD domain-containing protein [Deferribacterales bacterium Es71-Z0220]|uniref:HD domain-containing protein n=1 Tax=Deferrivibrio essentukiensis TaxID=2880922 RepID=UPI001F624BFF|nr:HD domain-containing protein [Deferrivibrio essentukiensis]MCB4204608.1 HD domain-containing protein [Deferrivibrio essentukiensis]